MEKITAIQVLDVPVHPYSMDAAVQYLDDKIQEQKHSFVVTANAEIIMMCQDDAEYKNILTNVADLVLPDGAGTVWAGRQLGYAVPERVAGFDLFNRLLNLAAEKGYRVFFFGASPGIAEAAKKKAESLYPYDFMCIADKSDDKLFEKIKEKYHATLIEYPMVRVANADKTEHLEGRGETVIQGQQIGISESTYYKLKKTVDPSFKKKSLNLDKAGKRIYVVHQQDRATKAQPVDWYYNKKTPTLHIGLPCEHCDYADHETTYEKKIVAGEEISSLTGCYSTPKCENLIVFSDEYFKKAQNEWKDTEVLTGFKLSRYKAMYGDDGEPYIVEGPTKLVFIQADKKYIDQIDRELEAKEEKSGAVKGTAMHHVMQRLDFTAADTVRQVEAQLYRQL